MKDQLTTLGVKEYRLDFTVEDYTETKEILLGYMDVFVCNEMHVFSENYTKGHLKRGVE